MERLLEVRGAVFMDKISYPHMVINRGEILFITGPSGTGKSVLFKLLNGTVSPSSGAVLYKGNSIENMDTVALRREVLLVNQSVFLFDKTIRENFAAFYQYREEEMPTEEEMGEYLALCDGGFPLDAHCTSMSGGEKQRIYLAICISFNSPILLLDEPTSALDEVTGHLLFQNLTDHCRNHGKTLAVITHNKDLAHAYADRVLDLGEMVRGTREEEG